MRPDDGGSELLGMAGSELPVQHLIRSRSLSGGGWRGVRDDGCPWEKDLTRSNAAVRKRNVHSVCFPRTGDDGVRAPSTSGRCFNAKRSGTAGATINRQLRGMTEAGEARVLRPTQVNGH